MSEMDKLDAALTEMGIEHTYERNRQIDGGSQIIATNGEKILWDAVCSRFSYGGKHGLLEVMGGYLLDGHKSVVEGWLTAEDVVEMVKKAGALHV